MTSKNLHQLRAPSGDFVGRAQEIAQLVQALGAASPQTAAVGAVHGAGGAGKTELAHVVAHLLRGLFPDGQLLVELRGASPAPLAPELALQTLLRAFEPMAQLPDSLGQLQARYRDALAGRSCIILADDALDADQVRPLLPPPGCALLVTSRAPLGLPAAATLDLAPLPSADATALLLRICPSVGEHAEPLALLCGYQPLALRLGAGALATEEGRDVAGFLDQLDAERLLLLTEPDDPAADLEATLRLSYESLAPAARAALSRLSVFPASFDPRAAQAVIADETSEKLLELLLRRGLLSWDPALGRLCQHDLVRAFAATRLKDPEAVRLRHARHYAQVAAQAQLDLVVKGDVAAGLARFDRERPHIDAGWAWAVAAAGSPEGDRLLYAYANALTQIGLLRYHPLRERIPQLEAALAAARRLRDRVGEGAALDNLGLAYAALGETERAIELYQQSLAAARASGDHQGEGAALGNLGNARAALGDIAQAIELYQQSLAAARASGDRHAEAHASWNLGLALRQQGDLARAAELMQACVDFEREQGHPDAEADAEAVEQLRRRLGARRREAASG